VRAREALADRAGAVVVVAVAAVEAVAVVAAADDLEVCIYLIC